MTAQENVDLSALVKYEVQRDGKTKVTNEITITNLTSYDYAKNIKLNIFEYTPRDVLAYENDLVHDTQLVTNGKKSTILVSFSNNVVGIGNKRKFNVEYFLDDLATETGQIWELTIPKLENSLIYSNYNVIVSIPKSMGELAYISPNEDSFEEDDEKYYYVFSKDKSSSESITAGFGEFQVFKFEINYHLENTSNKTSLEEIAIPPDTSTQTMFYESINPVPEDVVVDDDGNWIATYEMDKRQKLDVKVVGKVQIYSSPRRIKSITEQDFAKNTSPTKYWESGQDKIVNFSKKLKTSENIYEFTKNTLSYNYSRIGPNLERKGALYNLENPKDAICIDFTDLFIALSRAAGIPAREINGFAYTENSKLQPLSLVSDVLHSWAEYWDSDKEIWVPVDPTWGSTSNLDYFGSSDLRHFAFVIHGSDPELPYSAGSYKIGNEPQKDVFVEFSEMDKINDSVVNITHEKNINNPFKKAEIEFQIHNSGPKAIYSASPKIYFDNQLISSENIEILPPFSKETINIEFDKGLIFQKSPDVITITVENINLDVKTNKYLYILTNLTIIFLFLTFVTLFILKNLKKNK